MVNDRLRRWECVLYIMIVILAVFTRFYMLGERAISHDESIHTKFSWNLFSGEGFQHNPMMHGPLLFEATALVYTIFGVSDFTSRIFVALVGIVLVVSPILFRTWLGKYGALLASFMLLISPSISYYSRYIRHDIPLALTAVLLLWLLLKYLEGGTHKILYWVAVVFSLMYATKEASYIYTAIYGVLFFIPFVYRVFTTKWDKPQLILPVIVILILIMVLATAFLFSLRDAPINELPLDNDGNSRVAELSVPVGGRLAAAGAFSLAFIVLLILHYGVGEKQISQIRLYDVLIVIGSLTLPLGSALLMKYLGGINMESVYEAVRTGNLSLVSTETLTVMSSILIITMVISLVIGMWWNRRRWLLIALIHYSIFFVTYTTIFTWGFGVISGLLGGLAYWLSQQGVKRGNQPFYYYGLIGFLYEYLPVFLSMIGGVFAVWINIRRKGNDHDDKIAVFPLQETVPLFLTGWTAISWIAYTWAGEKMPWLFVHIALPSIFLAAWFIGRVIEKMAWLREYRWISLKTVIALVTTIAALFLLLSSAHNSISSLEMGVSGAGFTLEQLRYLGQSIGAFVLLIISATMAIFFTRQLGSKNTFYLASLVFVIALTALTIRTSFYLNFINFDMATEFLVYAHGTPDIKVALKQVEEISWRVTGSPYGIKIAYGEDGSWPMTWYMVHFPNNYFYSTSPNADTLGEYPVVIAGTAQYGVVEEILGEDYLHFDYKYLWWPIQDYYNLTFERVRDVVTDPAMRKAVWKIIWKRDYVEYAALKNPFAPFTLQQWPYRRDFRLYIRKEIANEVWTYKLGDVGLSGLRPEPTLLPDPFRAGETMLTLLSRLELPGSVLRGIALAPDGTMYVTDTANHRVWHIDKMGNILGSIGSYGAEIGQFIEPWDVAVDELGNIYVADTWNHRIQKFDAQGTVVKSWGALAQVTSLGDPLLTGYFFGPRGIAYNGNGEIFVSDTGNKRIQVFDTEGAFLHEFGGYGNKLGMLDEPVGIFINSDSQVGVVDTWNRRIQIFTQDGIYLRQWSIPLWDPFNPDEKPYMTMTEDSVFVSDAVRRRILVFDLMGGYKWSLSADAGAEIVFPQGLLVTDGVLWVADAHKNTLFAYQLPE